MSCRAMEVFVFQCYALKKLTTKTRTLLIINDKETRGWKEEVFVFSSLRRRKCRLYSSSSSGFGCCVLFCVCVWFGLLAGCGDFYKQYR